MLQMYSYFSSKNIIRKGEKNKLVTKMNQILKNKETMNLKNVFHEITLIIY
jgi:hypothetical protein